MATWETEQHGEWTCPKCGNVYAISCFRYPSKDQIHIECECGQVIYHGNSTRDYSREFLRKGDPKNAVRNPPL